jgi:hypothetical protein
MRVAALINYFSDIDMLRWQCSAGCLDHYDRIYIWDGPYGYLHRLPLFPDQDQRLDQSVLGKYLLNDSRVVYCHRHWRDEAEKRIDAYAAIEEDLVVLHDTDEFFCISRASLKQFWDSSYAVASQYTQNLYAGGLRSSAGEPDQAIIEALPHKRVLFKRTVISPERHLDYCWLVGVHQQATDETLVCPEPLGHTYHLTACRSPSGQATKMAFYMSLALSQQQANPVVERLSQLVASESLSLPEAQAVFLRGDPGFAGVPNPAFGFSLCHRLHDPGFPQDTLEAMLAEVQTVAAGSYLMLNHYPLQLWIPARNNEQTLGLQLDHPSSLHLRSWIWHNGKTAQQDINLRCSTNSLELNLPSTTELLGRLITTCVSASTPQAELHHLEVTLKS